METKKLDKLEKNAVSRFKRVISSISLSLLLLLNPAATENAKADWISPTPKNLILSPAYSFLDINLWHGVFNDDKEKLKTLKSKLKKILQKEL